MVEEVSPYNPYKPPEARVADTATVRGDVEADRQKHLKTEASIRSIGLLYVIVSWFLLVGLVALGVATVPLLLDGPEEGRGALLGTLLGVGLVYGLLFWLNLWVGRGLRNFRRGPRLFLLVTSWIGLIGFPLGTLISIFLLLLLLGEKGKRVFEPDYPAVIAATPHLRYRTPVWIWVLLLGFLALLALLVVLALLGAGS